MVIINAALIKEFRRGKISVETGCYPPGFLILGAVCAKTELCYHIFEMDMKSALKTV